MAMVGDVVKSVVKQAFLSQITNNVFYHQIDVVGSGTLSSALDTMWYQSIIPAMKALQSVDLTYIEVEWQNIRNLTEFGILTESPLVTGDITGDVNPSWNAVKFRYNRETRITRDGYKALGGVPEAVATANTVDTVTWASEIAAIESQFERTQTPASWQIRPIIYGAPTGAPNNLPERINRVSSVTYFDLTTQLSRKPKRIS